MSSVNNKRKNNHQNKINKEQNSKNNNIPNKNKIQSQPSSSTSNLLRTFNKFTIGLNSREIHNISFYNHDKVCFILINTYENENQDLGIGPLNDGFHIGLYHHRLDYKVYYLYNPPSEKFINFFEFFLQNTTKALTVFFAGHDSANSSIHEIEFTNGKLSSNIIKKAISEKCNGKAKVLLISDSYNGGSVFDLHSISYNNNQHSNDIISFWVKKNINDTESKEMKKSHGIFIYYFCKIIGDSPKISPNELVTKINPSISNFNECFKYDATNQKLADEPLFS